MELKKQLEEEYKKALDRQRIEAENQRTKEETLILNEAKPIVDKIISSLPEALLTGAKAGRHSYIAFDYLDDCAERQVNQKIAELIKNWCYEENLEFREIEQEFRNANRVYCTIYWCSL